MDAVPTDKVDSFVVKATNVPPTFFENRDEAKRYFRRFGKVKLVMFKPKRNILLIEYANEDSMLNALEVAGEYKGHFFNVTRDTETIIKKKKVKKDPDPEWTPDPEITEELEAMGGLPVRTYDLRGEAMSVDPVESPQAIKSKQRRWKGAPVTPKPQKKSFGAQSELFHIIKQQALTVEDKYRILDARDKLIRIKLKNLELTKTRATVGTCPDMCPEKERLMRETQHQVALYEQEEGGKGMNPTLAVKQYSRSSADQEAALPQELRPVSVLQITMGYLMHRIMGLCDTPDVNLAEWYHFLWDRTRGIRKDITQQELCCQGSVELVEQCARFHIFCSARLVSEDASVFDQKINTENLTKCLQTLKYMYHDLQLKGESCRNEPEFRAYIILLNLNDGNFMWEVQQLKKHIQQSKEVKFALEVYSSLDKRNYVKFFKLVNSTTFLTACTLMRYFIQVRISAIKTLLKSYSPRVSQTSLPVYYLTKILAFESSESAVEFFETYGLFTNVERTRIVLDKLNFADPEYPYVLDRAINLVESKRTNSTGEVVCGRQLPPKIYEHHVPQDSFDKEGYLKEIPQLDEIKREEPIRSVEKKERVESPITIPKEEPPRPFSSPITIQNIFAPQIQNEYSNSSIFGNKTESVSSNIFTTNVTTSNIFGNLTDTTTKSIFGRDIVPIVPTPIVEPPKIIQDEVDLEQKRMEEEEKRRREEEAAERRREEERKREELLRRKLLEEKETKRREEVTRKRQLEEERRRIQEQERRRNIEIKAGVSNCISDLIDTVEKYLQQITLIEIRERVHQRRIREAVRKWKENTRRKRKRKALDFNPLWFSARSVKEEAQELRISSQDLTLSSMKRYKTGKPFKIEVNEEEEISRIDLCELTYKLLTNKYLEVDNKLHNELFWKVIISLPDELEYSHGLNHIEKVLDSYIKWEKRGSTSVTFQQSKSSPTVTYCLEKQKGLLINRTNDTHGFIFIADDFSDALHKRILHNFENFGVFVKIPLVLILQTYEHKSNLNTLLKEGIISDYLILVDKFTSKNLTNLVEEALVFLSTRVEKTPPLEMDTLKSFLLKYLCSDVWKRANSFAKWNSNYKNCLRNPGTVIYLHNEALERLKTIILNDSCKEYPKFPEILKEFLRNQIPDSLPCDYKYFPSFWDKDLYLNHIRKILDGLKLPNFLGNWPPKNQLQLESSISKYCKYIVKEPQKCFYKIMSVLLRGIDQSTNFEDVSKVVWTDIIELVTMEKLGQTDFSLYGTGFVNRSVFNQLIIVYDVHTLNDYVQSDWFYINNPVIKQKILRLLEEETVTEEEEETHQIDIDIDIDKILENIQKPRDFNVGTIKNDIRNCRKLLTDLEDTVLVHKKILEKSGDLLKTIIEN